MSITVEYISKSHREAISSVLRDPAVERWSSRWSTERIEKLFKYAEADAAADPRTRDYFYWAVLRDGAECVGMTSCHPVTYDKRPEFRSAFFISIVLSPRVHGKGIGTAAMRATLAAFRGARPDVTRVYADVHRGNAASDALFGRKLGFRALPHINVRIGPSIQCTRYIFELSRVQAAEVTAAKPAAIATATATATATSTTSTTALTTFVSPACNPTLVHELLGATPVASWEAADVMFKPTLRNVDFARLPRLRFVNQLEASERMLTTKSALLRTGEQVYGAEEWRRVAPHAFEVSHATLDECAPRMAAFAAAAAAAAADASGTLGATRWIVKPSNGFEGRDIVVCDTADAVAAHVRRHAPRAATVSGKRRRDDAAAAAVAVYASFVVQKYIERPLLLDGRKFDVRMYALVTRDAIYVYRSGFVRVAPAAYAADTTRADVHVTNMKAHGYEHARPLAVLEAAFGARCCAATCVDFVRRRLAPLLERARRDEPPPCRASLVKFELFGIDLMYDAAYAPWLIEINKNPGMGSIDGVLEPRERIGAMLRHCVLGQAMETCFEKI